ncbi:hypothetical protein C8R44DRAFT_738276 [Mycena epipterygia]|nr:hypothetical protein C8R44DRAFT_738276 [Mycena epipterygia]
MHRCLKIREMVDMMFELSESFPGTLTALATTCTTFQNPALDILWREQDTLVNLLRCMPTDLIFEELESEPPSRCTIRFLRPIVATDWDRLRFYGQRVKHLSSGSNWRVALTEIFPTLSMCLVDERLLPNLSTLHWSHRNIEFQYIHLFLTKITTISLSFDDGGSDLSLLSVLLRTCPTLKDVSISLQRGARQFKHLTCAAQSSLSRFIHGLHHMPMFATLGDLALRAVDLRAATEFLGIVVGACLKSVRVAVNPVGSTEQLGDFSSALALCSRSHTTLTSLSIDNSATRYLPGGPSSSNLRRTLFCFGQLREIDLHSEFGFDLDDTDLSDMVDAWPALESLKLQGQSETMPRATLQSLRMIARYCPHLHTLRMAFDAIIPPPTDETAEHVAQHSLTSLHVEESSINPRTLPIAHFLSRIFPNLNWICTGREFDDNGDEYEDEIFAEEIDFHRRWKQVESQLDELGDE